MNYSKKKFSKVMGEYSRGTLRSGKKGNKVKNSKQAVAIAYSEARKSALGRMSK
jgi:hypothetical protein